MNNVYIGSTSGKKLYSIIIRAIKNRQKNTKKHVGISDFSEVSGLSRTQIYKYRDGKKPGESGLIKVVMGLKKWGEKIKIIF
jgi:predicted transcriptional regulator